MRSRVDGSVDVDGEIWAKEVTVLSEFKGVFVDGINGVFVETALW